MSEHAEDWDADPSEDARHRLQVPKLIWLLADYISLAETGVDLHARPDDEIATHVQRGREVCNKLRDRLLRDLEAPGE